LAGTYDSSYWFTELDAPDGVALAESLGSIAERLQPSGQFVRTLVDEGGRLELFVGLFASRLCDEVLPYTLLEALSKLRLDLRLDYYGPNSESNP
jgi:hypothetical protein